MTGSKRTIQSLATREKIRNAVLGMMQTRTLEEISVGEICKVAGVGIGTFYHHYKSKDDLALEAYAEMDTHFLLLASDPEAKEMTAYQYIIRHFICYARFLTGQKVEFSKKVYAMQNKQIVDRKRPIYTTLKNKLLEEKASGRIARSLNVEGLCDYINLALRAVAYDWCLRDGEYDLIHASITYAQNILTAYQEALGVQ
ncbi:MAG: TetR/AcrR family transcriptional regulator [Oscillospiraceae bacterium]|jgi:TetR/AcrR family fatty acid metabolism transcriptional regulator